MPEYNHESQHPQHPAWQIAEKTENNHARADGPDDLEPDNCGRKFPGPREVDQRQFEEHEEQSTLDEKSPQRAWFAGWRMGVEPGRQSREKHESRGTQVCRHSREE